MYRVELKDFIVELAVKLLLVGVPNVPCGVESLLSPLRDLAVPLVPNVPCGVESSFSKRTPLGVSMFLMYRVELKEVKLIS